ncbi:hypothetical protein RvY_04716 [Ramazzottius varieornatus]|uniref:Uncharacterized protein n=1 Tax=Ramazzottius varieornatus TaxID=947166 RepID=A0A1D1UZ93_RAMVA|nr:hypothetical protein RvY_04716 [Ramazzottius varieornatus]
MNEAEWIQPPSSTLIALSSPAFLPFLFSNQNSFPSSNKVAKLPSSVVDQSNWDFWTGESSGIFNGSWSATTQFPLFLLTP